jgi:outer membrane protein assembly factor BamB
VAATAVLLPVISSARADVPPCSAPPAADEWPTFGRDLANSRTQTEHVDGITPMSTPLLAKQWSVTSGPFAATSDINGTPIVSGGCVFVNTAAGDVIAIDASDGTEVWRTHIPVTAPGLGGAFVSSPAVYDGKLLALVSETGAPYVAALDVTDGTPAEGWQQAPIVEGPGYYTNATAVVANGLLLAGFSPAEGDPTQRGGITIYDASTGELLKRVYTIPDGDFANGYSGGGIWTAPAVDAEQGYAYAGTSNPYSKKIEHQNTNAIVKIDIDRTRETFGTIVGSYKGLIEQYDPRLRDAVDPTCEAVGEDPNLQLIVGDSAPCLQLDLDFGAPPNLFRDASDRLLIGGLQKAGVYHAADAATMAGVWKTTVGVSCAACNAAAWAFDGAVVGAASPAGVMESIGADDGARQWASPIADGTHYQSTSIANGVVFTLDNQGELLAFDEATGLPLLRRPLQADAGQDGVGPAVSSGGVAIAGGLVIAATGNVIVAYAPAA